MIYPKTIEGSTGGIQEVFSMLYVEPEDLLVIAGVSNKRDLIRNW